MMVDILTWMKGSTPEECREVGLLIIELGTKKRDAQWFVNLEAAIADFGTDRILRAATEQPTFPIKEL